MDEWERHYFYFGTPGHGMPPTCSVRGRDKILPIIDKMESQLPSLRGPRIPVTETPHDQSRGQATKAVAKRKTTKPRPRAQVYTTKGWPVKFREKIVRELAACEDIVQVAYENHVHPMQVVRCVERERYISSHRAINDSNFLQQVDRKAKAGLLLGLEGMAKTADKPIDWARMTELCRKLLEGTKGIPPRTGPRSGAPPPGISLNVQGDGARIQLVHLSKDDLLERARQLSAEIEADAHTGSEST